MEKVPPLGTSPIDARPSVRAPQPTPVRRHIVEWPVCAWCGSNEARRCPICQAWACRECTHIYETWGGDNMDVDLYCEHERFEPTDNTGWDSSGPVLPSEGLSRVR